MICYSFKTAMGKIPRNTRTRHAINTSLFSCLVIATLFFRLLTMLEDLYFNKIKKKYDRSVGWKLIASEIRKENNTNFDHAYFDRAN
jgi:hypothetical protein